MFETDRAHSQVQKVVRLDAVNTLVVGQTRHFLVLKMSSRLALPEYAILMQAGFPSRRYLGPFACT